MIETFASLIPGQLRNQSGSVFYSGRAAFAGPASVYVLGANPGGDPIAMCDETLEKHTRFVLEKTKPHWSAYCDESWGDKRSIGEAPLQRRVRHLLSGLELDPRFVPSSNLVFVRSRQVMDLGENFDALIDLCWPFHAAVLQNVSPAGIICLGVNIGEKVADRVGARESIGSFTEQNNRGWTSKAWRNATGLMVFGLSHPGRADWTNPKTDPTPLLRNALREALPKATV